MFLTHNLRKLHLAGVTWGRRTEKKKGERGGAPLPS